MLAWKALAESKGGRVYVLKPLGAFVARGVPIFAVLPPPLESERDQILGTLDIGPSRTMQEDVEFGFRQIVDVGLKAISPAINDPSTAATCIDHLGRLLLRLAERAPLRVESNGVIIPCATHEGLVDLAFGQLRQYGRADMAVALRLMRVLGELAGATRATGALERIEHHARLLELTVLASFDPSDCVELTLRRAVVSRYTQPG